ncbi:MAG TPA: potassium channel family protein [Acidimicrobiia bacterium]|nr:potassium channel family protein [Acidimicrobiia bacterium]
MTEPANPAQAPSHGPVPDKPASSGGVVVRERYGLVLALILGGYLLAGFETNRFVVAINTIIWVALLLTTLWSPSIPERLRRIGLVATVFVLVSTLSLGLLPSDIAAGWRMLILAVAQLAALLAILNRISRHEVVTLQTVMGGIAAYALIAFVMAAVYHGAELLSDGAFLNGVVAPADYTYFSFVTLTTVGYGDITAASDLAKRLAVVEAFVGQVFIVTLVARLVSLWGVPRHD